MIGLLDTIALRRRRIAPQRVAADRMGWVPRLQAGMPVDHETALRFSAVWACVRIISETLASVPWRVHRRQADGGRELVEGTIDDILHARPNGEMSAFEFRQALMAHVLTWGNGYAEIERGGNGQIVALWLLEPDRVNPVRDERGKLVYEIRGMGMPDMALRREDVFHARGLGFDGIRGYSVITMAAQAIGLGLATERFGADFFANGAHPASAIEYPGEIDTEMGDRMRESLRAVTGPGKWLSPFLLESGTKWVPTGLPQKDSQFLETRVFQVRDLARYYGVPLYMIADEARATFSNIEHQSIHFINRAITPWAVRLEQEANMKLLPRSTGKRRLFTRFNLNALLRGDTSSRFDAYQKAILTGWMNRNEARRLEDMDPENGLDEFLVPLNEGGASDEPESEGSEGPAGAKGDKGDQGDEGSQGETGDRGKQGARGAEGRHGEQGAQGKAGERGEPGPPGKLEPLSLPACRDLLIMQIGRLVRREAAKVDDAVKKTGGNLMLWQERLTTLYEEHTPHVAQDLSRLMWDLAVLGGRSIEDTACHGALESVVRGWIAERLDGAKVELLNEPVATVTERWRTERASADADSLLERVQLLMPLSKKEIVNAAAE